MQPRSTLSLSSLLYCAGSKPLKLDVHLVELIVFFRLSEGSINHLLAVTLAFGAVRGREVDILESAPSTYVQAENKIEVVALLDPVLHHVVERVSTFRSEARFTPIGKLVDNVHAVLVRPTVAPVPAGLRQNFPDDPELNDGNRRPRETLGSAGESKGFQLPTTVSDFHLIVPPCGPRKLSFSAPRYNRIRSNQSGGVVVCARGVQISATVPCKVCASQMSGLQVEHVASVVPTDRGSEFGHFAVAKSSAKMADGASNSGGRKLFVVPDIIQKIQMRHVLVWTARKTVEKTESAGVTKMKRFSVPADA